MVKKCPVCLYLAASIPLPVEPRAKKGILAVTSGVIEQPRRIQLPRPRNPLSPSLPIQTQVPELPPFIRPVHEQTSPSSLNYLICEGAFSLPEGIVCRALVDACFEFSSPFMPSLDRSEVLGSIDVSADAAAGQIGQGDIGILLFQAILFAGSAFVDDQVLQSANSWTRREARRTFYKRARLLYDFDIYGTHVEALHALLLMSFWYEDPDDIKDAWYWLGAEISHAQQFGLPEKAVSEQPNQRLYKRLWWSAYIRDALIGLGLRLPPRFKVSIPMLTLEDFTLSGAEGDFPSTADYERATIQIQMAKLCVCINKMVSPNDMSKMQGSPTDTEALDHQLTAWYELCCTESPGLFTREVEQDPARGISVGRILMHMTYYTAIYTLYLPDLTQSFMLERMESSSNPTTKRSYRKVQTAAYKVSILADTMLKHRLVGFVPTQGITCVLPAASILLLDLKSPLRPLHNRSADGLRTCMRFLEQLGERYAASETVLNNLRDALKKVKISLEPDRSQIQPTGALMNRSQPSSPVPGATIEQQPNQESINGFQSQSNGEPYIGGTLDNPSIPNMDPSGEPLPDFGEDHLSSELYKEPFFHHMSNFLTIESDFLEQFAVSPPFTSNGNPGNTPALDFPAINQDPLFDFFSPANN